MADLRKFGIDCKMRRTLQDKTQKEISVLSGLSLSTVSRIESGETDPRLSTVDALSDALDAYVEIKLIAL